MHQNIAIQTFAVVKEVIVHKCTSDNLIDKSSYPNQVTNNMTKDKSNRTSINDNTQHVGGSKSYMATKEIPLIISNVGLYPSGNSN